MRQPTGDGQGGKPVKNDVGTVFGDVSRRDGQGSAAFGGLYHVVFLANGDASQSTSRLPVSILRAPMTLSRSIEARLLPASCRADRISADFPRDATSSAG